MNKLTLFTALVLLIVPFVLIAVFWNDIPDTIPIHYNLEGEADNWASKEAGIFILPGTSVFVFLLMYFLPQIDPKNRVTLENKGYAMFILIMVGFFAVLFGMELTKFLGYELFGNYFVIVFPLLFLLLGNYMTKVQPNYFVGIRTPWTLESEEVWRKTHRFGGRLWVFTSLVMIILGVFFNSQIPEWSVMIYLLLVAFIPLVYSYVIYKQEQG